MDEKNDLTEYLLEEIQVLTGENNMRQYKDHWSQEDWKQERHNNHVLNRLYGWVKWLRSL